MTAALHSPLLARALAALEEQRNALMAGDAAAIVSAGEHLSKALSALQSARPAPSRDELASLREAVAALSVNAALLGRLSSANQRALMTLFEPAVTYGVPGQSNIGNPSRTLRSA